MTISSQYDQQTMFMVENFNICLPKQAHKSHGANGMLISPFLERHQCIFTNTFLFPENKTNKQKTSTQLPVQHGFRHLDSSFFSFQSSWGAYSCSVSLVSILATELTCLIVYLETVFETMKKYVCGKKEILEIYKVSYWESLS